MAKVKDATSEESFYCYDIDEIEKVARANIAVKGLAEIYFEQAIVDSLRGCLDNGIEADIPDDCEDQLSEAASRGQAIYLIFWPEICQGNPLLAEVDLLAVVNDFMAFRGIGDIGLAKDSSEIKNIERFKNGLASLVKIMDEKISNSTNYL